MRTLLAALFFLFALWLITALGCSPIYLVALPDGGTALFVPPHDGGVVVQFDGGVALCLPNPSCIVEDAGACHAGFQECLPDGTLGPCQAYGNCPKPTSTCAGFVDIVFILDDSQADVSVADFIIAQQAAATFVWENQQWNYLYAVLDVPGCAGQWVVLNDAGLERAGPFLPYISIQCMTGAKGDVQKALADVLTNTSWVAPGGQLSGKFVFVFTPAAFAEETVVTQGVTVTTFGYGQNTLDELFNRLTADVVCR